jgi:hypothetical protein
VDERLGERRLSVGQAQAGAVRGHADPDARARNLLDVSFVGSATHTEDRELGEPGNERRVLARELEGVALIEFGSGV